MTTTTTPERLHKLRVRKHSLDTLAWQLAANEREIRAELPPNSPCFDRIRDVVRGLQERVSCNLDCD